MDDMVNVMPAKEPYRPLNMGSLGQASNMFIRQYKFPLKLTEMDTIVTFHSDRVHNLKPEVVRNHFNLYMNCSLNSPEKIEKWFRDNDPKFIKSFLVDLVTSLGVLKDLKESLVTGFRVLGSVSRGHAVWTMQLFIKDPDSPELELYSSDDAPNILKN